MAPIVARLQAYGAQGGLPSNYLAGGQGTDFVYSQPPGRSWYRGGTANGSLAFMGANDDLCYVDKSMAPGGMTRATSYLMTVTGSYFGAGLPEIAGGGVKTGWSWGTNTDGDLEWRFHDGNGTATEHAEFRSDGSVFTKRGVISTGVNLIVTADQDVVVATAAVTVTIPDAALSLGRTVAIKNGGVAGNVTVNALGGTIDGDASELLAQDESIVCISDGVNWWIL